MRLIDDQSLTSKAKWSNEFEDYVVTTTDLDAAPTIACAECEHAHDEDCPDDIYRRHVKGWECMAHFGCTNFQRRQP